MSASRFSVYLCNADGERIADASNFISMEYTRVVNAPSWLKLELPATFDLRNVIIPDGRIEVWRRPVNGVESLETEAIWLIQNIEQTLSDDGVTQIMVEAVHPLWALQGRYVLDKSTSAAAKKTNYADDMIKAIVREQAEANAPSARRLPITVQTDAGLCPVVDKAFAYRPVLEVLQEIAQSSAELGIYLAFDLVGTGGSGLEFRTYTLTRGVDRRFPNGLKPLLVGPEYGNVGAATFRRSWDSEVTSVTIGGPGEGNRKKITTVVSQERALRSPWRYIEAYLDSSNSTTAAERGSEAQYVLRANRPWFTVEATLLSTPGAEYGVDWQWGDFLTLQAFGLSVNCRVEAVTFRISGGEEQVDAVLRSEQYL
jgi:hypothetical protein